MVRAEPLIVTTIAFVVGAIAVLYRIALRGNSPSLTKHLSGLNQDRTESRLLRALLFVVTYGAGLYAILVFNGAIRVSTGTVQWWMVVVVGILAVVLVTDSLLG
jgi:hypothetical protein